MKPSALRFTACAVFAVFFCSLLPAADSTNDGEPAPYEEEEFSHLSRDIRRAEIIAFGTFPFVVPFSTVFYDVYRYFAHDMSSAYLPWPFKDSSTAVSVTNDEYKMLLIASAGISVGIAAVDFVVRRALRKRRESREAEAAAQEVHPIQVRPRIYSNAESPFPQPAMPQVFSAGEAPLR